MMYNYFWNSATKLEKKKDQIEITQKRAIYFNFIYTCEIFAQYMYSFFTIILNLSEIANQIHIPFFFPFVHDNCPFHFLTKYENYTNRCYFD